MSNTNEKTSKKETNELLYNDLGVMAAELADVEDSSSVRIQNPFFSSSRGLSIVVTHTINLKIEKFDIFIFTSKHMDQKQKFPWNSSKITFHMAPD